MRVGVRHQPKAMEEDPTAARRARAQGAGGVHPASWGNPRDGGRAGGGLKPEVKVTIGGDTPRGLGGDVVTFEDMRDFLVVYSEYEQHMHVTTQMMVADDFYPDKPWVDLSEEEPMQGLKRFAVVDMQKTGDEDFAARSSMC